MRQQSRIMSSHDLTRFVLACGGIGLVLLAIIIQFRHIETVRGLCGGIGSMASIIGLGVGLWSALRLRSWRVIAGTIPSLATRLPIVFSFPITIGSEIVMDTTS